MTIDLVGFAIGLAACSGFPALLFGRGAVVGQRLSVALLVTAATIGAIGAAIALGQPASAVRQLPGLFGVPALAFGIDALSATFLLPVFVLTACAAVYGLAYWPQRRHRRNGRRLGCFLGLLTAALALLLVARDGIAFLFAWEVMALSCFFLVVTEDRDATVRSAGWIYLAATHLGTLVLFLFFALLQVSTGSMALQPIASGAIAPERADALFVLALIAFGLKAGLVPLHFWLPPAHASAPSHVSAVMSGVLIKMGVYGILRTCAILPQPPAWWGQLLLGLGALSAFVGVALAIGQHDLKRLLAYHSIENIGIICLGLGLGMAGRTAQRADWMVLGFGGGLLHVWNHALFKGLLFLAAGATIRRAGTRAIDLMGGLGKAMPLTAAGFLIGAVAICGLPPLNGFVSELCVYLGLFAALDASSQNPLALLAVPVLAMVGAMALLCFVKVFGAVYLGLPRRPLARQPRESEPAILLAMAVLVLGCLGIGLLPWLLVPLLDTSISICAGSSPAPPSLLTLAPLRPIGALAPALLAGALLGMAWLRRRRGREVATLGTWDCGFVQPTPRIQYTAASFSQPFVALFGWLLLPRVHPRRRQDLFPSAAHFHSEMPDLVLDRTILPALRGIAQLCLWLRHLQGGRVNLYLLYVFLTLLVLLLLR